MSYLLKEGGDENAPGREKAELVKHQEAASLLAVPFISGGFMKHLLCTYHVPRRDPRVSKLTMTLPQRRSSFSDACVLCQFLPYCKVSFKSYFLNERRLSSLSL